MHPLSDALDTGASVAKEFHIEPAELAKLGKHFASYAYDIESALKGFKGKTDSEAIHDGFGLLTESEEVTSAYIELSENMSESLGKLHKHLEAIGELLRENAKNSEKSDEHIAAAFKQGEK
ncbi:type VII secretion target [Streptomyces lydicus]|uniref:type VII secretion target n=1 Tax=Streptomyces lydicus TaxID=47763 RepID=UPI001F5128EA|nr:type VII secretion target [Streptomyces lydicus]MCZ1009304.1 type VII secretion target [Streptomyces lydicus]